MKRWSNRKIAVVGLFIAIGIVLVILGNAFVTIPSFKTALAGAPVKITGFLLGPVAGGASGIVVDLLSLLYRPTFYFPGYTLDMIMVGVIPGFVFLLQKRSLKKAKAAGRDVASNNSILFLIIFATLFVLLAATIFIVVIPNSFFQPVVTKNGEVTKPLITNKWIYLILIDTEVAISLIVIFILKFYLRKMNFNNLLPIITFCFFIEYYLIFSTPLWDKITLGIPYSVGVTFRITFATVKMWFNVTVLYFIWKVIHPMIKSDEIEESNVVTSNFYEKKLSLKKVKKNKKKRSKDIML